MKRFIIMARIRGHKKKWMPLYRPESKKGVYKKWGTADNHINRIDYFYVDLEFKIKEVEVLACAACGKY